MFRIEKNPGITPSSSLETSAHIQPKSAEIIFSTESAKDKKEGYSLMGLELKDNPPQKLLNHISDTLKQNIIEDSPAQIKIAQGNKGAHWCAYTTSYFLRKNGVDIPVYYRVTQFMEWGKKLGRYKPLKSGGLDKTNYQTKITQRETEIQTQMKNLKEGDLIIWQSNTLKTTGKGAVGTKFVSHIGIVTGKTADGKIKVTEGNANIPETTTVNGVSGVRTGKKTNGPDRLMEKTYTAHDLAVGGYSGYISMDGLVK